MSSFLPFDFKTTMAISFIAHHIFRALFHEIFKLTQPRINFASNMANNSHSLSLSMIIFSLLIGNLIVASPTVVCSLLKKTLMHFSNCTCVFWMHGDCLEEQIIVPFEGFFCCNILLVQITIDDVYNVYGKKSFLSKESNTLRSYRVYISPTT